MYEFYKDVKLKNTKNLDKILKILEKEEWTLGIYKNNNRSRCLLKLKM
jgi:hypothetical protein